MFETTVPAEASPVRAAASGSSGSASRFARFGRELAYLLLGLPYAVVTFVALSVALSVGFGMLALFVGLPILVESLVMARAFARGERSRVEAVTGRPLPPHHYMAPAQSRKPQEWLSALLDPQSWRDVAHVMIAFPLRIVGFCIALTWTLGGLGELLYVTWSWSIPRDDGTTGLLDLMFDVDSIAADNLFHTGIGVLLLATAMPVVRLLARIQTATSRALLSNEKAALLARTEQLAAGRRSAVAAEAQTLRRLERDLHDGPQQRLVRLTMDLEAMGRRLDADEPDRARPLVDEMIAQTREALDELRALSRGIAPPILADRGLGPALAAAAARCPVPVTLATDLPEGQRFAAAVENTAYFVATEALTNVAKHAAATRCTVTVRMDPLTLHLEIRDDGHGGAHLGKGHGLVGLSDRLAAVEGRMNLSSPAGGPTVVAAEIPLRGLGDDELH
ncbi:sensor histidine kinase [Yinghuangia soli]|uniref:histidine kinase n=1 Tax=Yinghuangia soli TaxID=2908204 RepID=A0AA41Q6Y7_9ACTN|nr:sensor histidine kinase [Yinghuangia soli]MCF2532735.1 sensor domain-containing protein [Yinghuangia soli]